MNGDHKTQQRRGSNASNGSRGFSQFSGLTGDIEGGLRYRTAQHTASKHQRRLTKRKRQIIRFCIGAVVLLLLGTWAARVYRLVLGEVPATDSVKVSGDAPPAAPPQPPAAQPAAVAGEVQAAAAAGAAAAAAGAAAAAPRGAQAAGGARPLPLQPMDPYFPPDPAAVAEAAKLPLMPLPPAAQRELRRLFDLGARDRLALVKELEGSDPLGVYGGGGGEGGAGGGFKCPPRAERWSEPDVRDLSAAEAFRGGDAGAFLYFQHIRKAGGTAICDLAKRNMPPHQVPRYYCMPDLRGAMATPPWSRREHLLADLRNKRLRMTANEWDALPRSQLTLPGAVFLTSLRHPLDRWYSQYRFEHLEHRDGMAASKQMVFTKWYPNFARDSQGNNYYVKAFCGAENPTPTDLEKIKDKKGAVRYTKDLLWSWRKFKSWGKEVKWDDFLSAIDALRRFHLVLITELMDDGHPMIEEVLGWRQPPKLVRPHEKMAHRKKGEAPSLAREGLTPDEWNLLADGNAFDLLFYHYARRIYLERRACSASGGATAAAAATAADVAAAAAAAAAAAPGGGGGAAAAADGKPADAVDPIAAHAANIANAAAVAAAVAGAAAVPALPANAAAAAADAAGAAAADAAGAGAAAAAAADSAADVAGLRAHLTGAADAAAAAAAVFGPPPAAAAAVNDAAKAAAAADQAAAAAVDAAAVAAAAAGGGSDAAGALGAGVVAAPPQ